MNNRRLYVYKQLAEEGRLGLQCKVCCACRHSTVCLTPPSWQIPPCVMCMSVDDSNAIHRGGEQTWAVLQPHRDINICVP